MNKLISAVLAVIALAAAAFVSSAIANAQEPADGSSLLAKSGITASGTMDVYTDYVWRGFLIDSDNVIQPGLKAGGYGVTASVWGNLDYEGNDFDSDELDYVIDYTYAMENMSLSAGHTYYDFFGTDLYSKEFYAGVTFTSAAFAPSLFWFHDYGDEAHGGGDGDYAAVSGSYTAAIPGVESTSIVITGRAGYNNGLFISGEGFDVLMTAGLPIKLTGTLTFTPTIAYSIPFGDLADEEDGNQNDRFYGGAATTYTF